MRDLINPDVNARTIELHHRLDHCVWSLESNLAPEPTWITVVDNEELARAEAKDWRQQGVRRVRVFPRDVKVANCRIHLWIAVGWKV